MRTNLKTPFFFLISHPHPFSQVKKNNICIVKKKRKKEKKRIKKEKKRGGDEIKLFVQAQCGVSTSWKGNTGVRKLRSLIFSLFRKRGTVKAMLYVTHFFSQGHRCNTRLLLFISPSKKKRKLFCQVIPNVTYLSLAFSTGFIKKKKGS